MTNSPELTSSVVACGHCFNTGRMLVIGRHNNIRKYGEDSPFGGIATYDAGTMWRVLLCEACNRIVVQSIEHDDRFGDSPAHFVSVYPEPGKHVDILPIAVAKAFKEAQRAREIKNAYAVLLGRLLETICVDQQAMGKTLADGVKTLCDQGILPRHLVDAANSIRFLRNIGAHAQSGGIEDDDIPILDALTSAVLEYVYVAPRLVADAKARIAARDRRSKTNGKVN